MGNYGYYGWKEFLANKKTIINNYNIAKEKGVNRPAKTEHGNLGEAEIRKWLTEFLPTKFGITSGYIIPELIGDFKLLHYDVIIYDKINSPILWTSGNPDNSGQGEHRAIPSKYVYSILEVKATFNTTSIKESIEKLNEVNSLTGQFPKEFSCGSVFMEVLHGQTTKVNVLKNYINSNLPYNYWGGIILNNHINIDATGIIRVGYSQGKESLKMTIPLVKNLDSIKINLATDKKSISFNQQGAGVDVFYPNKDTYHFMKLDSSVNDVKINCENADKLKITKKYEVHFTNGEKFALLTWSINNFAEFVSILLNALEGSSIQKNEGGIVYGHVFDEIK